MLSATLLSIHNLHTLIVLMNDIRQAILADEFDNFVGEYFQQRTLLGIDENGKIIQPQ
jgi:tRNA-guanine family transglycosylase